MSKPKTGKAIMTDGEIVNEYLGKDIRSSGDFDYSELLKLMAQARQQGIAKGVADGKKLSNSYNVGYLSGSQIGYAKSVADLKARLTSGKVVMNMNKWRHTKDGSPHYGLIIEQALAEAERK